MASLKSLWNVSLFEAISCVLRMQKLGLHKLWEDVILLSHLAGAEQSLCEEEVGNATALIWASATGDRQCQWLSGHLAWDKGWSGLLSHLAVKEHSIKKQQNTWTATQVCDCCSVRMLFSVCECGCTHHGVGEVGPLHQSVELKPQWTWPNQKICCCPELLLVT